MCDRGLIGVTSLVGACSTLSSLRARDALDSLISYNILIMASFCDGAEDVGIWSAVFEVLTVPGLLLQVLPKYEPSSCVESFLIFLTETLARADALTFFLAFGNVFLLEGIIKTIKIMSN